MQLGARKPHLEMFSYNHNDITTFSHVRKTFHSITMQLSKNITFFKAGCTAVDASLFIQIKIRLVSKTGNPWTYKRRVDATPS